LWHLKYRFGGKEKKLAFGAYPDVSLAAARDYPASGQFGFGWRQFGSYP
jgi:hypothetical protein